MTTLRKKLDDLNLTYAELRSAYEALQAEHAHLKAADQMTRYTLGLRDDRIKVLEQELRDARSQASRLIDTVQAMAVRE